MSESILLGVVFRTLLCNFLCVDLFLLSLPAMLLTAISGKSRLLRARFHTEFRRRCRVVDKGFHL
jgi:hypothetical protein